MVVVVVVVVVVLHGPRTNGFSTLRLHDRVAAIWKFDLRYNIFPFSLANQWHSCPKIVRDQTGADLYQGLHRSIGSHDLTTKLQEERRRRRRYKFLVVVYRIGWPRYGNSLAIQHPPLPIRILVVVEAWNDKCRF